MPRVNHKEIFDAYITLNDVRVDYMTITSYRDEIYTASCELANRFETHERKQLGNYEGWYVNLPTVGSAYVGWGVSKGMAHNLIQLHGNTAHRCAAWVADNCIYPDDRLRRLDVQITVLEPPDWSQWALLKRLGDSGRMVNFRQSKTGKTVYIGSMNSERFCRVYQKKVDGGNCLRLEVEMSGLRAERYLPKIGAYSRGDKSELTAELLNFAQMDKKLEQLFAPSLTGATKPIKVGGRDTKTEDWLRNQVLPSLEKYCNSHDADPILVECLRKATGYSEWGGGVKG